MTDFMIYDSENNRIEFNENNMTLNYTTNYTINVILEDEHGAQNTYNFTIEVIPAPQETGPAPQESESIVY